MYLTVSTKRAAPLAAIACALVLGACSQSSDLLDEFTTSSVQRTSHAYPARERDCMARAMFFESIRSSREGLVAVGTVVMNRVDAEEYPDSVCGVVGQRNQFAPGVMTREMNSRAMPDVMAAADAVLAGERHTQVQDAMFFHQAGLNFPYPNMHYVLEAGGNVFYERRGRAERAERGVRPQSQLSAAGRTEKGRMASLSAEEGAASVLSYEMVDQAKADAIGALIAAQQPQRDGQ